jgi:hypothetical protein
MQGENWIAKKNVTSKSDDVIELVSEMFIPYQN